jgi:isoquinoline 1-oxidoreductase alpha subunit
MATTLTINGEQKSFDVRADMPLLWVLRDMLGMTGTKFGCGIAQCGACTVHIDGKAVRSCILPVSVVRDRAVTTIEGVGATPVGAKVQKAWLDLEVIQCGYCQPGRIMSAAALLAATPSPDDSDIDALLERCKAVRHIDSLQPPWLGAEPPPVKSPGAPGIAPGSSVTARCNPAC